MKQQENKPSSRLRWWIAAILTGVLLVLAVWFADQGWNLDWLLENPDSEALEDPESWE